MITISICSVHDVTPLTHEQNATTKTISSDNENTVQTALI